MEPRIKLSAVYCILHPIYFVPVLDGHSAESQHSGFRPSRLSKSCSLCMYPPDSLATTCLRLFFTSLSLSTSHSKSLPASQAGRQPGSWKTRFITYKLRSTSGTYACQLETGKLQPRSRHLVTTTNRFGREKIWNPVPHQRSLPTNADGRDYHSQIM